jgi:hypothetical protein
MDAVGHSRNWSNRFNRAHDPAPKWRRSAFREITHMAPSFRAGTSSFFQKIKGAATIYAQLARESLCTRVQVIAKRRLRE